MGGSECFENYVGVSCVLVMEGMLTVLCGCS